MGGLGLPIFLDLCNIKYNSSLFAASQLVQRILNQVKEYEIDQDLEQKISQSIKKERNEGEPRKLYKKLGKKIGKA